MDFRKTLETGEITGLKYLETPSPHYQFGLLENVHLETVHALDLRTKAELGDAYQAYSRTRLSQVLAQGLSVGLCCNGRLIAFRLTEELHANDYGLRKPLEILSADRHAFAFWGGMYVAPAFRRRGIARLMCSKSLELIAKRGLQHIYVTVAPSNDANLANLLRLGFVIQGLAPLYGGAWRYILHCDRERPCGVASAERKQVARADRATQQHLLRTGFVGVDIAFDSGDTLLSFVRNEAKESPDSRA